jgi:hypothetical protein
VERKVFLPGARQGRVWPPIVQFFWIMQLWVSAMHIMLDTCEPNLRGRGWVEHAQMHLALKKGTNFFYYTSSSWEIFSEFTILVDKNPNNGYEGPCVL